MPPKRNKQNLLQSIVPEEQAEGIVPEKKADGAARRKAKDSGTNGFLNKLADKIFYGFLELTIVGIIAIALMTMGVLITKYFIAVKSGDYGYEFSTQFTEASLPPINMTKTTVTFPLDLVMGDFCKDVM